MVVLVPYLFVYVLYVRMCTKQTFTRNMSLRLFLSEVTCPSEFTMVNHVAPCNTMVSRV